MRKINQQDALYSIYLLLIQRFFPFKTAIFREHIETTRSYQDHYMLKV